MTMARDAIKGPDMSRNIKLAGKTVYSRGWNVTYDEDGYAVKAIKVNFVNPDGERPAGDKARPIEEVLAELGE